jgi:hypothetical protein
MGKIQIDLDRYQNFKIVIRELRVPHISSRTIHLNSKIPVSGKKGAKIN